MSKGGVIYVLLVYEGAPQKVFKFIKIKRLTNRMVNVTINIGQRDGETNWTTKN